MNRLHTLAAVVALGIAVGAPAGGRRDLESTPQVRAYRALLNAIRTGDYRAYKDHMVKEAGPRMDDTNRATGKDPKDVLSFLATLTPRVVEVTGLKVDGKKATLYASGSVDGEANEGTIEMAEEDGEWRVAVQTWTTTKAPAGRPSSVVASIGSGGLDS